jgi:CRP/FNR family transcriptional regulator
MSNQDNNGKKHYTAYPTRLLYLTQGTKRLEELGILRHFPKNFVIIEPDEVPRYCYIVKKGRVITFEFTPTGEERVYNFMEEGSILLEANMLRELPAQVFFRTTVPTDLVCIEREELIQAMKDDFQLTMDIIIALSDKFFSSMDQIRQECSHNAKWKFCNLLLIFADRYGQKYDGKVLIHEKVSQQMLSNLLGINRITAVRIVKELKELRLIEQINGFYCIRNVDKLKEYQTKMDIIP